MNALRPAAAALASFFVMGAFWGAWAALVPEIQLRTRATPPELGAALLWAGAAALPAMLLTGRLWAHFGGRLVPPSLLLFGLAAVGPALAPSVLALAVSLALVGAASGALDVAMNTQVSQIEVSSGGRLMFLAHALFSLAVLLASIGAGILRGLAVEPLPILATVALAFLLVAAFATTEDRGAARTLGGEKPARMAPAGALPGGARGMLVLLGLLCAGAFMIEDALISWSALHLERSLGAEPAIGGAGPGLFAGAMFVGRSLGQAVARRLGDREIVAGGAILAALGILLVAGAPASAIALAGLALAGLGISLVAPALFSRAGREAGERSRGAAIARLTVFGYIGFVVGPPVVGLIAGATELRFSFVALAALAATLALISRLSLRQQPVGTPGEELPPVARA
ncbi:MAG: MFS transporter [Chloroflexota bacterium]|nr:MFS transporter [Chloroflexota bacterium]